MLEAAAVTASRRWWSRCRRWRCTAPTSRALPLKERDRPLVPRGVRGVVARAVAELLVSYREHHAVEFTALALANVYGPRQRPDGGVVGAFVHARGSASAPSCTATAARPATSCTSTMRSMRWCGPASGAAAWSSTSARVCRPRSATCGSMLAGARCLDLRAVHGPARSDDLTRFASRPARARIHLAWAPWTDLATGLVAAWSTADSAAPNRPDRQRAASCAGPISGVVITDGVTTHAHARCLDVVGEVGIDRVDRPGPRRWARTAGRRRPPMPRGRARPASGRRAPSARRRRRSATRRPPCRGARRAARRRRRSARIGPIDTSGFDGATTIGVGRFQRPIGPASASRGGAVEAHARDGHRGGAARSTPGTAPRRASVLVGEGHHRGHPLVGHRHQARGTARPGGSRR